MQSLSETRLMGHTWAFLLSLMRSHDCDNENKQTFFKNINSNDKTTDWTEHIIRRMKEMRVFSGGGSAHWSMLGTVLGTGFSVGKRSTGSAKAFGGVR
jgi:hypothetical protein